MRQAWRYASWAAVRRSQPTPRAASFWRATRSVTSAGTGWMPGGSGSGFTQQPAASVPCGLTAAGLPVGLQMVGPRYDDWRVLRAARAYEMAQPFPMPDVSTLA